MNLKPYGSTYSINELIELSKDKDCHVSYDLSVLKGCYYDHLPEICAKMWADENVSTLDYQCNALGTLDNKEVKLHILKERHDGRRLWTLILVVHLDQPVMLIQNAGREGDDSHKRYIISKDAYQSMLTYVHSLIPTPKARWDYDEKSESRFLHTVSFEIMTNKLDEQRREFVEFYGSKIETAHNDRFSC